MSGPKFEVEILGKQDRSAFNCARPELSDYFHRQVGQDIRGDVTRCFVAVDPSTPQRRIAGYYTLSAASLPLAEMPEVAMKGIPRYAMVPVILMGRLAVDQAYTGMGLGTTLLIDALKVVSALPLGAFALVVDAKDTQAADFYLKFGFMPLDGNPLRLFLPCATARKAGLLG